MPISWSCDSLYSPYLAGRAGGQAPLVRLGQAMAEVARATDFAGFYGRHRAWYGQRLDQAGRDLDAPALSAWLQTYYGGQEKTVFHFVLAPAQLQTGGYSSTVMRVEAGQPVAHVYQVVRRA